MEKENPVCWCDAEMKQEFHNQVKLWVCKGCWWNDSTKYRETIKVGSQ